MELRWVSLLAVMLLCVSAMPTAPAASVSVRMPYEGAAATTHASPAEECSGTAVQRLGVVCAAIPKRASHLSFRVDDAAKLPVGGSYYLYDAAGNYAGSGVHCNGTSMPVGAAALIVIRLEAVNGPIVCASQGGSAQSVATRGIISVDFS